MPTPEPTAWIGLVLGSGQGRRMGFSKALLSWPTRSAPPGEAKRLPIALVHAQTHLAAGAAHVLVVVRRGVADVLAPLASRIDERLRVVVSEEADELGPAGSIRAGRANAIESRITAAAFLCTPVDAVPPEVTTVQALIDAVRQPGVTAARPARDGRRGHPVAIRWRATDCYGGANPPPPLRDVLRALGPRCRDVDVSDPATLTNLDRPPDVRAWLGEDARPWRAGSL